MSEFGLVEFMTSCGTPLAVSLAGPFNWLLAKPGMNDGSIGEALRIPRLGCSPSHVVV